MASRVNRTLARSLSVGLALGLSPFAWANETFPTIHDAPITVQVRSGLDGKPVPRAHLLVVAGYDQQDLRQQTWHEEAQTDSEGKARLSDRISNLPFLQVWVTGADLCQRKPRNEAFSVDRVRRDGVSTPNECGFVTSVDEPGTFTVFVKPSKKLIFPKVPRPGTVGSTTVPEMTLPESTAAPVLAPVSVPSPAPVAVSPTAVPLVLPIAVPPTAAADANGTDQGKRASQPAKDAIVPVPTSGPAIPPAPGSAAAPSKSPASIAAPVIQAPASPPPVASAPGAQPNAPAAQIAPKATVAPTPTASPLATAATVLNQPAFDRTNSLRRTPFRRVAGRTEARSASRALHDHKSGEYSREVATQQAALPGVAKPDAAKLPPPAPPAPKIPVSLEAAPPPPPSVSTDASPRPKIAASRRHAAVHPSPAQAKRLHHGNAPGKAVKVKTLPAPAAPAPAAAQ
jgi:hypothetical protein